MYPGYNLFHRQLHLLEVHCHLDNSIDRSVSRKSVLADRGDYSLVFQEWERHKTEHDEHSAVYE